MESGVPSPAFPAVLRNGAPITREYSGYLELAPHAVKRKNGESGSDNLGTGNRFQNSLTSIPDLGGRSVRCPFFSLLEDGSSDRSCPRRLRSPVRAWLVLSSPAAPLRGDGTDPARCGTAPCH